MWLTSGHWYRILETWAHVSHIHTAGSRIGEVLMCYLSLQFFLPEYGQLFPISAIFICPSWTLQQWHPSSTPVMSHDLLIPLRIGPLYSPSFTPLSVTHSIDTSYCSIHRRIYYQLSVSQLRWWSLHSSPVYRLDHQSTNFIPTTNIPKAPTVHYTCACHLTIAENWDTEFNESLNLTPLHWSLQLVASLKTIRGICRGLLSMLMG